MRKLSPSIKQLKREQHHCAGLVIHEVVILTIIPSILLALLLPAVQNAREAARRMSCSNNLKQHSIGIHVFDSTFGRFPPGCTSNLHFARESRAIGDDVPLYSWGAVILPYIEEDRAHDALINIAPNDLTLNFYSESRKILEAPFAAFRCPSDVTAPWQNIGRSFDVANVELAHVGLANYVGNNGSGELATNSNGLFFRDSRLKFGHITDGSSNTVFLGERAWERYSGWTKLEARAALTLGVRSSQGNSYYGLADTLAAGRYRPNFNAVRQSNGLGESYVRRGFSSNHPGRSQFVFADGSVRSIVDSVDFDMDQETQLARTIEVDSLWEQLLSRNDGGTNLGEF